MREFSISEEDERVVAEWSEKESQKVERSEKHPDVAPMCLLTYSFTPTGIGTVVKVRHGGTGAVLDLSHIEDW